MKTKSNREILNQIFEILIELCNNGTITVNHDIFNVFSELQKGKRVSAGIGQHRLGEENYKALVERRFLQASISKDSSLLEFTPRFKHLLIGEEEPIVNLKVSAQEVLNIFKKEMRPPEEHEFEFFEFRNFMAESISETGNFDEPFNYEGGRDMFQKLKVLEPFFENSFLQRIENEKGLRLIIGKRMISACQLFHLNTHHHIYYYGGDYKVQLEALAKGEDFTYERVIATAKRIFGFERSRIEGDSLEEGVKLRFSCGFGGGHVHLYFKKDENTNEVVLSADMANPIGAAKDVYKKFLYAYEQIPELQEAK